MIVQTANLYNQEELANSLSFICNDFTRQPVLP